MLRSRIFACAASVGSSGTTPDGPSVAAHHPKQVKVLTDEDFDALHHLMFVELFKPPTHDKVRTRKGVYAAKTELQWICDWAAKAPFDETRKVALVKRAVLERVDLKKPLTYILGWQPFLDADIKCRPPVLIPRSETEQWAMWLRRLLEQEKNMEGPIELLDMCCGSGCVGVALAKVDPRIHVTSVDISDAAVQLTEENFKRNQILSERWSIFQGDMFGALGSSPSKKFDIIVSNPPYISEAAYTDLPDEIQRWEDRLALVGDKRHDTDPTQYFRELCDEGPRWLRPNRGKLPSIVVEFGDQYEAVGQMFDDSHALGWRDVELHVDWGNEPRWLAAALEA